MASTLISVTRGEPTPKIALGAAFSPVFAISIDRSVLEAAMTSDGVAFDIAAPSRQAAMGYTRSPIVSCDTPAD